MDTHEEIRLDNLYRMVAHIYSDKIISRTREATFAHLVEVCGMLTIHDRKKKREGLTVEDALCKALGWYFPLLAKLNIVSVEEVIFRKFPRVCPYCRKAPHRDAECKQVRGTEGTVNHSDLLEFYKSNHSNRPRGLNSWQQMFQDIYPREADDRGRSTIGLLEELGEMSEALRVFDKYPKYFIGEAADLFSYFMGIANEFSIRLQQDEGRDFSFEKEFFKRYPGLCLQCGSVICVCPAVPSATVGRMAKELDLSSSSSIYIPDFVKFSEEGAAISATVLELVGGYSGIASQLPFDRGDANHALVSLCLGVADAVNTHSLELASRLRAEALRISTTTATPGSPRKQIDVTRLFDDLTSEWRKLDTKLRSQITADNPLAGEIGEMMEAIRVLVVLCSPKDQGSLGLLTELKSMKGAAASAPNKIKLDTLPAATVDDLRKALLVNTYDVVHFSGHADTTSLIFENESGLTQPVPLKAIADLFARHPRIQCIILNGCESAKSLLDPLAPFTVGMTASIDDDAAIEFSRGFYDALAAGKDFEFAISEGISSATLKNFDASPITLLRK